MRKIEDYRKHAEECRDMATRASGPEQREMLLKMAATWESLAKDRGEQIERMKRIKAILAEVDGKP